MSYDYDTSDAYDTALGYDEDDASSSSSGSGGLRDVIRMEGGRVAVWYSNGRVAERVGSTRQGEWIQ